MTDRDNLSGKLREARKARHSGDDDTASEFVSLFSSLFGMLFSMISGLFMMALRSWTGRIVLLVIVGLFALQIYFAVQLFNDCREQGGSFGSCFLITNAVVNTVNR